MRGGAEGRNIEVGLEAEPRAHGRPRCVVHVGRIVPRRPQELARGARRGEAQRVPDFARQNLLVARQPGQDRQSRRVRRREKLRPEQVLAQIELGGAIHVPGVVGVLHRVQGLVENAIGGVNHQEMTVRSALDLCVRRNRIGPGVAFVRAGADDQIYLGLGTRHQIEWDTGLHAVVHFTTEILVKRGRGADRTDPRRRTRMDRQGIDSRVPDIVSGKNRTSAYRLRGGLEGKSCRKAHECRVPF